MVYLMSLYPTLRQEQDEGRMLFAPSVERLLLKLSLLTGIPVEHVEIPIKIEVPIGRVSEGIVPFQGCGPYDGEGEVFGFQYCDGR